MMVHTNLQQRNEKPTSLPSRIQFPERAQHLQHGYTLHLTRSPSPNNDPEPSKRHVQCRRRWLDQAAEDCLYWAVIGATIGSAGALSANLLIWLAPARRLLAHLGSVGIKVTIALRDANIPRKDSAWLMDIGK